MFFYNQKNLTNNQPNTPYKQKALNQNIFKQLSKHLTNNQPNIFYK